MLKKSSFKLNLNPVSLNVKIMEAFSKISSFTEIYDFGPFTVNSILKEESVPCGNNDHNILCFFVDVDAFNITDKIINWTNFVNESDSNELKIWKAAELAPQHLHKNYIAVRMCWK